MSIQAYVKWQRSVAWLLAGWLLAGCGDDGAPRTVASARPEPGQVVRGAYLVKVGDCAACHTAKGGAPFAGGVVLDSPYGKFYGTNITPHAEHGIGQWTADQFYAALHDGNAPGKTLYPAMPYTSYRQVTREDSDAIYAYLKQLQPAAVANHPHELSFPYNLRFGMWFWNKLFLADKFPDASKGQSASWQHGRYLVNGLGHCAECHTPRGKLGQMDLTRPLQGNRMARIGAPALTPQALSAAGWTAADLSQFLSTGVAEQGSAYGEMFEVVHLSTRHMSETDIGDMSRYLLGDEAPGPQPLKQQAVGPSLNAGRAHYIAVCAGCHGISGQGKPHVAVAMVGNSTVRDPDSHNLIAVTLDGIRAQHFGRESMQDMPGFAAQLSDKEVADLANYLRAAWGGQAPDVTEAWVQAIRGNGAKTASH